MSSAPGIDPGSGRRPAARRGSGGGSPWRWWPDGAAAIVALCGSSRTRGGRGGRGMGGERGDGADRTAPDGPPLGPPAGLVPKLRSLGARLAEAASALGGSWRWIPLALLAERAAIAGLRRRGDDELRRARPACSPAATAGSCCHLARPRRRRARPGVARARRTPPRTRGTPSPRRVADATGRRAPRPGPAPRSARRPAAVGDWPSARATGRRRVDHAGPRTRSPPSRACGWWSSASLWAGPLCGSLLAAGGRRRGQGRVDRSARRRSERPGGLLRPAQRRQAQRRARPDDGARGGRAPSAGRRPPTW